MRTLIAFLLCFVVAFQGVASAHILQRPCPMDHGQDVAMAGHTMADAGDCCNDADTVAKTGKLCKSDLPCSSAGACVLPSLRVELPTMQASDLAPATQTLNPSFDPSSVWRPPTLS